MVEIEKDRPLPRHTKLNYDECYAKIILESFFPDEYQDLQISDRPDLRTKDGNIGIEVTSAIPQKEQEALALASEIPYIDKEKQKGRIDYLKKKGYKYTKYGMLHPPRSYAWTGLGNPDIEITFCKDFFSAVAKKLDKLNSGKYELMARYDLFVISEIYIEEWMPEILLEKLISYSSKRLNYSSIYLLALNGIFMFDTATQKWGCQVTNKKLNGLSELARQMVEDGETNDKT